MALKLLESASRGMGAHRNFGKGTKPTPLSSTFLFCIFFSSLPLLSSLLFSIPFPPLLSFILPSPLCRFVPASKRPFLNPARGSVERCKLPQRVRGRAPAKNAFRQILVVFMWTKCSNWNKYSLYIFKGKVPPCPCLWTPTSRGTWNCFCRSLVRLSTDQWGFPWSHAGYATGTQLYVTSSISWKAMFLLILSLVDVTCTYCDILLSVGWLHVFFLTSRVGRSASQRSLQQ